MVAYTVFGGTKIVSITQRYQMIIILFGMALAFVIAVHRLPNDLSFGSALSLGGKMGKLQAVDFSLDPDKRYTFWSGIFGGFFLALSYFGADQSQVQRYLAGGSLSASRFGLLFNAIVKVPMQFLILLLGAMVFLFYQFEKPPMFFNQPAYQRAVGFRLRPAAERAADEVRRCFRAEAGRDPQLGARLRNFRNWMRKRAACATRPRKFSNRPARVRKAKTPIMSSSLSFCTICRMALSVYSWP